MVDGVTLEFKTTDGWQDPEKDQGNALMQIAPGGHRKLRRQASLPASTELVRNGPCLPEAQVVSIQGHLGESPASCGGRSMRPI